MERIHQKIKKLLFTPINPLTLGVFRIVFGFFALLESLYFYKVHLIEDYILQPKFLFNYDFLPLSPFSEPILQLILGAMLVSTLLMMAGVFYRVATTSFFMGFTYFFLLDKSYYNNHLYLIALIALLLVVIPADNSLTLFKKKKTKPTWSWHLRLLQFQMVVVYFFGGIAKLNSDWLFHLEPMSSYLKSSGYSSEILTTFLVYGGVAFDLTIGFLLLIKRTRILGLIGIVIFNISNHFIFNDINIFPFFMLFSVVLFFDVEKWKLFAKYKIPSLEKIGSPKNYQLTLLLLSLYCVIQLTLPLRHFFIKGNVDWTGEAQRFSWRMKIQSRKIVECKFAIFDLEKKTIYPVEIDQHIHEIQKLQMIYYPRMILDFAHYLGEDARKRHQLKNTMVKAKINIQFNQRKSIDILSPDIDLLKEEWSFTGHNEWINELKD